jgi:hypothetical protein
MTSLAAHCIWVLKAPFCTFLCRIKASPNFTGPPITGRFREIGPLIKASPYFIFLPFRIIRNKVATNYYAFHLLNPKTKVQIKGP